MPTRHSLTDTPWTVRVVGHRDQVPAAIRDRDIPATVPGCIHTDLMAAGLIDDPYLGLNERDVQWIGRVDWQYRTTFDVDSSLLAHEHVELLCEGLDTVADVELNGREIGHAENMHMAHRFEAKPHLKPTGNELVITFRSAVRYAQAMEQRLGTLSRSPYEFNLPYNFIRKNACNFGWDWGPTLVTCGLWKPIALHGWSAARIDHVRPLVRAADAKHATVDVHVDAVGEPAAAGITLTDPDGQVACQAEGTTDQPITLQVERPKLWYPRGYGDQPLYQLDVTLCDDEGHQLDAWHRRIGLRTSELDTSTDDVGTRFALKVNGREVYAKGANWIPDDVFMHRACAPARYRARIQQAIDCHMNVLRVWGGGIYETDAFYDICDELGVMAWQDFLFACAAYAEEQPLRDLVEAEARYNVARLSHHASLVIYNGCNENIWGHHSWGWQKDGKLDGRTWGAGYYFDLLPNVVGEVDSTKPYWPGSPYSGTMEIDPNHPDHGNKHNWEVWFNSGDYRKYRQQIPRFCSEFGFQGPACHATFARAIAPEQLAVGSDAMKLHQKSPNGHRFNDEVLAMHFDVPDAFDDRQFLLQVNQARALQTGVEWFRAHQPRNMGAIYWSLNACWPVTCWAAIDGDGRPKPMWYATRRFFAPRLLTIQPIDDGLSLFACNDTDERWSASISINRMGFDGRALANTERQLDVPPRATVKVDALEASLAASERPDAQLLLAHAADGERAWWFFEADKNLRYPAPQFDAKLTRDGATHRLTITAQTFCRELCVFADRLDPAATVSDQLVTLLPGESHAFEIRSDRDLNLAQLTDPPVLRAASEFGRR